MEQHQSRRKRSPTVAAGLLLVVAGWAATLQADYLPVTGPAPLRFQAPAAPREVVPLPPLRMVDPPPPVSPPPDLASARTNSLAGQKGAPPTASQAAALAASGGTDGSVLPVAPPPGNDLPPVAGESLPPSSAVSPIVTPQMLVQFFWGAGSNAPPRAFVMPTFVPPSPPDVAPSSSATYSTP